MRKVIKLGITGGIASGKTRATGELGAQIVNSDELGHQTYLPGTTTYNQIIAEFGKNILEEDGRINRGKLGARVFGDAAAIKRLEDFVWPAVLLLANNEISKMEQKIQENPSLPPVIVLEAALLIEAGWKKHFDKLWVFSVPPSIAQQRIMTRNSLSAEEAMKRLNSQKISNNEREREADIVFETNRDPDLVKQEVVREWHSLLATSKL